jgi:hypothetical protein
MTRRMKAFVEPTQEEIAACAYMIFNQNGGIPGHELEYWLQAEAQLMADRLHDAGVPFTIETLHQRRPSMRQRSPSYEMDEMAY